MKIIFGKVVTMQESHMIPRQEQFGMSRLMTKPAKWVCAQRRLRSDWVDAQSDQSLLCVLNGKLRTQGFFMQTAKTLISLGSWSESSLGAQSLCWFCHGATHIVSILHIYQTAYKKLPSDFFSFINIYTILFLSCCIFCSLVIGQLCSFKLCIRDTQICFHLLLFALLCSYEFHVIKYIFAIFYI